MLLLCQAGSPCRDLAACFSIVVGRTVLGCFAIEALDDDDSDGLAPGALDIHYSVSDATTGAGAPLAERSVTQTTCLLHDHAAADLTRRKQTKRLPGASPTRQGTKDSILERWPWLGSFIGSASQSYRCALSTIERLVCPHLGALPALPKQGGGEVCSTLRLYLASDGA